MNLSCTGNWYDETRTKEHGKNNFAISSANHPTECDGYFGFAEVIFPVFLRCA